MYLGFGTKCRSWVDHPAVDSVPRSRGAQVGVTAAIFDPAQEEGRVVLQQRRPGVEDRVRRIRPVLRGEDRIARMALEQGGVSVVVAHCIVSFAFRAAAAGSARGRTFALGTVRAAGFFERRRLAARISATARRKESVDSAP